MNEQAEEVGKVWLQKAAVYFDMASWLKEQAVKQRAEMILAEGGKKALTSNCLVQQKVAEEKKVLEMSLDKKKWIVERDVLLVELAEEVTSKVEKREWKDIQKKDLHQAEISMMDLDAGQIQAMQRLLHFVLKELRVILHHIVFAAERPSLLHASSYFEPFRCFPQNGKQLHNSSLH